jgi:hypothetical protein
MKPHKYANVDDMVTRPWHCNTTDGDHREFSYNYTCDDVFIKKQKATSYEQAVNLTRKAYHSRVLTST